jgi:hypothetical protein
LREALERWPDEICLIEADRERENCRLTYRQFREAPLPLAANLQERHADALNLLVRAKDSREAEGRLWRALQLHPDFYLDGPVDVMVDGEVLTLHCQTIEVLPAALNVMV